MSMTRYGMVLNPNHCVACGSCAMACKCEHDTPNSVHYLEPKTTGGDVMFTPAGTYPDVTMGFYTLGCQHCENPACVEVCPVGATYKREEDGIVIQDTEICIGCKSCIAACPYGVRTYIEDPQWVLDFRSGDLSLPEHKEATVEKCTFCVDRIDRGETPACMEVCRFDARAWGDLDDPDSEVSKLIATHEVEQLLSEQGTNPNVYLIKA